MRTGLACFYFNVRFEVFPCVCMEQGGFHMFFFVILWPHGVGCFVFKCVFKGVSFCMNGAERVPHVIVILWPHEVGCFVFQCVF